MPQAATSRPGQGRDTDPAVWEAKDRLNSMQSALGFSSRLCEGRPEMFEHAKTLTAWAYNVLVAAKAGADVNAAIWPPEPGSFDT